MNKGDYIIPLLKTNEDLADFIFEAPYCFYPFGNCSNDSCKICILNYLNKELKEE